MFSRRSITFAGMLSLAAVIVPCHLAAQSAPAALIPRAGEGPLRLDGGSVALEGPWQFHLGDNSTWASPTFDDSSWEQLSGSKP
jgi:hypothetical protein